MPRLFQFFFACFALLFVFSGALRADVEVPDDALPATPPPAYTPASVVKQDSALVEDVITESPVSGTEQTLPVCTTCVSTIKPGTPYLKLADGRNFCSKTCYKAALPVCSVCRTAFENGYTRNGSFFCSQDCLNAALPKCACCKKQCTIWKVLNETNELYCPGCLTYPRCSSCLRPDPKARNLEDGRYICQKCLPTAVLDFNEAKKRVIDVNRMIAKKINIRIPTAGVGFHLVSPAELKKVCDPKLTGTSCGAVTVSVENTVEEKTEVEPESGLEIKVKTPKQVLKYDLYILNTLSRAKFMEVAAHELTTLYFRRAYPEIRDPALVVGFSEYVASEINRAFGNEGLNIRMQTNPDPFAGDGYRKVREQIEKNGLEAFKASFDTLAKPDQM